MSTTINKTIIFGNTMSQNFVYNQNIPASVWNITHGLNKLPAITVIDSANSTVEGYIEYVDDNNVILKFNGAFSGTAILN